MGENFEIERRKSQLKRSSSFQNIKTDSLIDFSERSVPPEIIADNAYKSSK